jgi:hypothetical protein
MLRRQVWLFESDMIKTSESSVRRSPLVGTDTQELLGEVITDSAFSSDSSTVKLPPTPLPIQQLPLLVGDICVRLVYGAMMASELIEVVVLESATPALMRFFRAIFSKMGGTSSKGTLSVFMRSGMDNHN